MRWLLFLLSVFSCLSQTVHTNKPFHLPITFDTVANAQWYGVIVYSNGVQVQRRYSMTNTIAVSNLWGDLFSYQFRVVASNSIPFITVDEHSNNVVTFAPESDESPPLVLRWMTVTNQTATNINGPWWDLPTNSFAPGLIQQFFRTSISNFDGRKYLYPD